MARRSGERTFGLSNEERFWLVVRKTETCWLWEGTRNQKGYGRFWINGRLESAHRFSSMMAHGPILPDKPHVLHHCDNPPCVRPDHLWRGTNLENAQDKARKKRARSRYQSGECNRIAKLTRLKVAQIRAFIILGVSCEAIAAEYQVSAGLIWLIRTRKIWNG